MLKAEQLRKSVGGNMAESMGIATDGTSALQSEQPDIVHINADERQGRKAWREAGFMSIDNIEPDPNQPRREFPEDDIKLLAASIEKVGLLNPITIRWDSEREKHIIVTGERRYRAAKFLGYQSIKCVFDGQEKSPHLLLQEQLIENCVREGLNDIDRATAFERLRKQNDWTAHQLADALCISKATVSRTLKLLQLSDDIQNDVANGELAPSIAYQIATKTASDDEKRELANKIKTERLSREEAAKVVGGNTKQSASKAGKPVSKEDYRLDCGAKITLTFRKKRITKADRLKAAEELLARFKAA